MLLFALLTLVATASPGSPVLLPPIVAEGLQERAFIITDPYGVPHVFARNAHDLYFVTGYLHARDRLFQMDLTRRQASGTLAELLGRNALESDVQLRTLGLRRAAEESAAALSAEAHAELQAYADGVNVFIRRAETSATLPPEYGLLELTDIEPWTIVDSLVIGKAIAFQLSFDLDAQETIAFMAYVQALSQAGLDGAALFHQDLFRSAPANPAAVVPDAQGRRAMLNLAPPDPLPHLDQTTLELIGDYLRTIQDLPLFRPILSDQGLGSNWFLISGEHTASGFPMLANDPHLQLTNPSVFYEIDQKIARGKTLELAVTGVTFPGVPYVILGQTDRIAWGATNNPMDVTDMYSERIVQGAEGRLFSLFRGEREPISVIPEQYRVNRVGDGTLDNVLAVPPSADVPPATLVIPRHGPIVNLDMETGEAVSVQYTGFFASHEVEAFRAWNRAQNLEAFEQGLKFFDFGSQNWAYADVEGNIAYFTSAELPLRSDLEQGFVDLAPPFFIRDGTGNLQHEWLKDEERDPHQALPFQTLPFEEMPQIVNPPRGFIVSANNDPAGTTLDNDPLNQKRPSGGIYYLNKTYDIGFRAGRLTELIQQELENDGTISVEDAQRFLADVTQLSGRRLAPFLIRAIETALSARAPQPLAQLARDPRLPRVLELLKGWSYATPTGLAEGYDFGKPAGQAPTPQQINDSIATTLTNVWIGRMVRNTIDAVLNGISSQLPRPGSASAIKALIHLLESFESDQGVGASGVPFFDVPNLDAPAALERDLIILKSLQDALELLAGDAFAPAFGHSTNLNDYRWGKLHRIVFSHVLGGPLNLPPDEKGFATDGGYQVPDASSFSVRASDANGFRFSSGPSRRYIAVLDPKGVRSFEVIPGGESGVPGTRHYGDQLPLWLSNEFHDLLVDLAEIVERGETWQDFIPLRRTPRNP